MFSEPVVAIAWNDESLICELREAGYPVYVIPASRREVVYNDSRRKLDIWFNHFRLKSPSRKIQRRYLDQFINWRAKGLRKAREGYNIAKFYMPSYQSALFREEEMLLHTSTNLNEISRFIEELNVDAVFTVTPFHKQEDILLRACRLMGKKMITSILSFDNITKRGWIPVEYDLYIVWNQQNKEQLHRIYPFTRNRPVHVCGPAQFDFYFNGEYLLPMAEWRRRHNLDEHEERKIILYAGGPRELFPFEPDYLKEIDDAVSRGDIRNAPYILFRCHPMDNPERWKTAIGDSPNIIFEQSWNGSESPGYANVTGDDIRMLCSTLAYTDVHINVCSTMSIDGSAFNKPQIGPAYTPGNGRYSDKLLERMYLQEHFEPVINTGAIQLAHSASELVTFINNALENGCSVESSKKLLTTIATFTDGKSTERVAKAIEEYLCEK